MVNEVDGNEETPLFKSIRYCKLMHWFADNYKFIEEMGLNILLPIVGQETAKLLIEHGADVNLAEVHGTTPLMKAVEQGNFDIWL